MKKKEEKKASKSASYYVKLSSLADLARNVSTFGEMIRPVFAVKEKGSHRLIAPGIKLDDTRIIFYVEVKKLMKFISYQPKTTSMEEKTELTDAMPMQMQQRGTQSIQIIELMKNPFEKSADTAKAQCIRVNGFDAIIKAIISKSIENESIGKVYSFRKGNKQYIGSFNIVEEDETKVFCYAEAASVRQNAAFFRYNYNTDTMETTELFGEHSYLYVRIINLEEPFSFFKPE